MYIRPDIRPEIQLWGFQHVGCGRTIDSYGLHFCPYLLVAMNHCFLGGKIIPIHCGVIVNKLKISLKCSAIWCLMQLCAMNEKQIKGKNNDCFSHTFCGDCSLKDNTTRINVQLDLEAPTVAWRTDKVYTGIHYSLQQFQCNDGLASSERSIESCPSGFLVWNLAALT